MEDKEFFTFREYMKKDDPLTASMEDYLEMIFRLSSSSGFTRIHDLAASLNVQPPSATKMVQRLAEAGLVNYEKYGIVELNNEGQVLGKKLLERHRTVEKFLELLGVEENLLEETEKIEHTISDNTLKRISEFVHFSETQPEFIRDYHQFKTQNKNKPTRNNQIE